MLMLEQASVAILYLYLPLFFCKNLFIEGWLLHTH